MRSVLELLRHGEHGEERVWRGRKNQCPRHLLPTAHLPICRRRRLDCVQNAADCRQEIGILHRQAAAGSLA